MSHVILEFLESSLTPRTRRPDGVMNVSHVRLHVHFGTKCLLTNWTLFITFSWKEKEKKGVVVVIPKEAQPAWKEIERSYTRESEVKQANLKTYTKFPNFKSVCLW